MTNIRKVEPKPAASDLEIVEAILSALHKAHECDVKSVQISMHVANGVYCTIEAHSTRQR